MLDPANSALLAASLESWLRPPEPPPIGQKFLAVQLGTEIRALLTVEEIAAIVNVDVLEILPVPQMCDWVLGVYNWRSEMLWLVDLGQQMGLPSILEAESLLNIMVVVAQVENQTLGFVVSQIFDLEYQDLQKLQPAELGLFPPRFLTLMQGYFAHNHSIVLNLKAIVNDPLLQVHSSQHLSLEFI